MPTSIATKTSAPPGDRRLATVAIASAVGLLALGALAWAAHADAILLEIANAALAMCM